jgi:dihydrofolate reductase
MGRVTYEQMAGHWPNATGEYADFMNKLPKVVFSKTLPADEWAGSRIARGDLTEEIAALKSESGGEVMAHGGAAFVQALSRLGLIDEYRLSSSPSPWAAGCRCSRIWPSRCAWISPRPGVFLTARSSTFTSRSQPPGSRLRV